MLLSDRGQMESFVCGARGIMGVSSCDEMQLKVGAQGA